MTRAEASIDKRHLSLEAAPHRQQDGEYRPRANLIIIMYYIRMSLSLSSEFNRCCGNPAVCDNASALYPCKLRKEYIDERAQQNSLAGLMEPGRMTPNPFAIEQNNAPSSDQTVFSGEALRSSGAAPATKTGDDLREELRARAAIATEKAQAMRAAFREDTVRATEKANSPEARAEREAQALRRSRGRGFGMDM